jgi:hypothetical protein
MRDYDYEIDGDDSDEEFQSSNTGSGDGDQVAFLDYGRDGMWIIGIMNPNEQGDRRLTEIIDEDSDINTLVKRAVYDWGVDPHELWVSPCAKEIATLTLTTGRRI